MSIRSTLTALSTALVFAIMLTAASTPAFAAKTNNGDTKPTTTVDPTDKKPTFEQVRPGSVVDAVNPPPPAFRPDVRVSHVSTIVLETSRYYSFSAENIGLQTAHNVRVTTVVGMHSDTSDDVKKLFDGPTPIGSLAPGESKEVMVICHIHMQPGYHCVNGTVAISAPDDLNPNNNLAASS